MKAAVIDLGFNSLKMVIYDVKQGSSYTVYDERSVAARLGHGLSKTGFLDESAIERTIEGLKLFKDVLHFGSVKHVLPIATSAVREAANRESFVEHAYRETGLRFRVLTGKEEALYSYVGAISATARSDVLFFDLGGGSLEIVSSRDGKTQKIISLPLGGLRLTELYANKDGAFSKKDVSKMKKRIEQVLPSRRHLGIDRKATLLGVGGTVRALARFHQELNDYPINKIHNYELERESIQYILEELAQIDSDNIGKIDSIGEDRSKTIVAGTAVVDTLMDKLNFEELVVSTHGLRDGVVQEFTGNNLAYYQSLAFERNGTDRKNGGVGQLSIFSRDPATFEFTSDLLDAIISRGLLDRSDERILVYAVGQLLEKPTDYGANALFYMIINEDSVLSHGEEILAALSVVRARKPRVSDWLFEKYRSILPPKSKKITIKKLAALAEMFEILERTKTRIAIASPVAGSRRKIEITLSPETDDFPIVLFKNVAREIEQVLGFSIETVITKTMATV